MRTIAGHKVRFVDTLEAGLLAMLLQDLEEEWNVPLPRASPTSTVPLKKSRLEGAKA